ncbi:MAG: phosphotransferase [Gammaproteobacteria bacterium]|nr:phosphotransferase [Gammaproteobacteria bacterium]MBP9729707.1 phosphotransferase [Gammaproteobacteria bacterium]
MTHFKTKILTLYGEQGKTWLNDLPAIVRTMTERYGLSELKPLDNLSYHYVLSGLKDNRPIILKLGLDPKGLEQEASALQTFEGFGAVSVLGQRSGALLLGRALPGLSLKSYFPSSDSEAIQIAYAVMKRLHQAPRPKTGLFPAIQDWLAILDKPWDIPNHYLEKARTLQKKLLATTSQTVLLHGDLHHDNILQHGDQWMAIDPKGVMGEPAYEIAAFIRNPIPELLATHNATDILENRIQAFSKILGIDTQRISDWCFVQAVLAWVWALEDGSDSDSFKKLTAIFNGLPPPLALPRIAREGT